MTYLWYNALQARLARKIASELILKDECNTNYFKCVAIHLIFAATIFLGFWGSIGRESKFDDLASFMEISQEITEKMLLGI